MIKEYIYKIRNMPEAAKASFFFTVCSFVHKGIALLTTPIFTRLLSTSEYGNYTVYQSWYAIAIIFCTLHIEDGAFNTGVIRYEDKKERFISSLLGLTSVLTVIFFSGVFLIKAIFGILNDVTYFMLVAMFLQILFVPAFSVWSANERFNFRYKKVIVFTLVYAVLNPLFSIVLICFTRGGSDARIAGMVLAQIIIGGYFYIFLAKKGKCFFDRIFYKFSITFSLPLILHYLSETILQQVDRLMIAFYIGKTEAAIYGVTYTISMMVMYVSIAINQSFLPYLYKSIKNNNLSKIKNIQKGLLILVFAVCVIAMLFSPEILMIFATKDYSDAVNAIPPIVIATFFIFVYNHFCYVEMYFKKNVFIMYASIITALLNIVLNAVFIPLLGYIVAGYTTLASYIIYCILHYLAYKKIIVKNKLEALYDIKFISILSLIAVIVTILMGVIYKYTFFRYAIILMSLLICIIFKNRIFKFVRTFIANKNKI